MKYDIELPVVNFDKDGFADQDGWVKVYRVDKQTGEFLGADIDRVIEGFSVAAGAYRDAPEIPREGHAIVRDNVKDIWCYPSDFRGMQAFDKETGNAFIIDFIGYLPDGLTMEAPQTPYEKWNGKAWETDIDAMNAEAVAKAEQQKSSLQMEAERIIVQLERRVRLGMAAEEEREKLTEWEIYSVRLSDIDISEALDITWPEKPNVAA
ncbi:tail fiber assembly protein [Xenorhabdus nematophila]|uniref:tail fiber assembly protein n=1 Tax=Xenorhabdus nematophila TaxID=628 RepID=UPI0032B71D5C